MATGVPTLPDDTLAGVFRGLPLRSLAVVRCVCKAWRDIVDDRALLLPHLLPQSVRGVFVNYIDHWRPHHLARPCPSSTIPKVDGMLSFLPNDPNRDLWSVMDHCNGLLLCNIKCELCVCNPATSRWTLLPRPQFADLGYYHRYAGAYIAFDPAESPHFQVVLIPAVPKAPSLEDRRKKEKERRAHLWVEERGAPFCLDWFFAMADGGAAIGDDEETEVFHDEEFQQHSSSVDEDLEHDIDPWRLKEWPPTPWTLHVFSSQAIGRRGLLFAKACQQGLLDPKEPTFSGPRRRYAIYHHGSLYVHCRGSFVTRLSLSNSEYQIIETPTDVEYTKTYLGKLQNDVCFGIVHNDHFQLKIWMLNESCGKIEWVMKYEVEVGHYGHYVASLPYHDCRQLDGSWTTEEDKNSMQQSYEWDSDNDDIFTVDHLEDQDYYDYLSIIGFHPFKEVVFMAGWFGVVAYHLNVSKIQYLGNSHPKCYYRNHSNGIYESFIYTPCMIGDLLHGDEIGGQSSSDED